MKFQCGQSMTEFAAGAAAVSLLLLGTLTLSSYQEVDRRGLLAARETSYLASWQSARLDVTDRIRAVHANYLADSAVQDPSGQQLLVQSTDVELITDLREPGGLAGAATTALLTPLRATSGFLGTDFDISGRTLVQGRLRVNLAPNHLLPEPFANLELGLSAPFALLGDAWNAGGVHHVEQRTGGLVPTSRLAAIDNLWRPLLIPLTLVEPSIGQLCLGLIEGDRIPENRLGSGTTPLPGRRCP